MVLELLTDPILRAPLLGSMLMCFSTGLIGSLVFLQKRSLVGEALSHASYPGVVLSVLFTSLFFPFSESIAAISVLLGAFLSALGGLFLIDRLEKKLKIAPDAALCFVLSVFFGIGVLIVSRIQFTHAIWFRKVQAYLFGQAATMVDGHIYLYGSLAFVVALCFFFLYRFLEILHFDRDFARSVGMKTARVHLILYFLLVLAIVVGMRSVGVVLVSAMLIAPAAAARQWTSRLSHFLILSSVMGTFSGFLGTYLSVSLGAGQLALPTGPMIVLTATSLCLFSLLFAPKKGVVFRYFRHLHFRLLCRQENLLKALYKGQQDRGTPLLFWLMTLKGWVRAHTLTEKGTLAAEKLIRLHRLWEVYLVHMGQRSDRVHHSAEEMEHILTPEIEQELLLRLGHPKQDPHAQPIPKGGSQ